jgi:hypothetical protein
MPGMYLANNDHILQTLCTWLNENNLVLAVITQMTRHRLLTRDTSVHYPGRESNIGASLIIEYFSMFLAIIILLMNFNLNFFYLKFIRCIVTVLIKIWNSTDASYLSISTAKMCNRPNQSAYWNLGPPTSNPALGAIKKKKLEQYASLPT